MVTTQTTYRILIGMVTKPTKWETRHEQTAILYMNITLVQKATT